MKTLAEFNKEYEDIIHNLKEPKRSRALADLMTDLEGTFKFPMQSNQEWESKNRSVIALYRKISLSRDFD